jgi:membrane fusion protein, heavy metal efflux system
LFTALLAAVVAIVAVHAVRVSGQPRTNGDLDEVTISVKQAESVKIEALKLRDFPVSRTAVGNVDFNQDRNVQVFSQYTGRIRRVFGKLGDDVKKGAPLFTIDSPDLVQAESTAISAAGVLDLTTRVLDRVRKMREADSAAQKDVDQAVSDEQTAEGNLKAARDTLRVFGLSDEEIDRVIASRKVDDELMVTAPIDGRITSRAAAPGLLVQPGGAPAPFTVADLSTIWLMGYLPETEAPLVRVGNRAVVSVPALPGRAFEAKVSAINPASDPNTHRVAIRVETPDPGHELLPQMMATLEVFIGDPIRAVAMPVGGVVREGDGTLTVWTTGDGRTFKRRTARLGLEKDGYRQVVEGLKEGESVAADGALFLSTMASAGFGGVD